jgi:hypothetical protein
MTCEYWDQGVPAGTAVLDPHTVLRAVLDSNLDQLTEAYRDFGTNASHALEYAVRMGKHRVTQRLVDVGVPVTRTAIQFAAKRRGAGIDLLLGGLSGEYLQRARSAAVTFFLSYGGFDKAYQMLDAGATPERYYIAGAYSGVRKKGDFAEFHEALDRMLRCISKQDLAESHLHLLIEYGRPIHIERAAEILDRQIADLQSYVAKRPMGIERLREVGPNSAALAEQFDSSMDSSP